KTKTKRQDKTQPHSTVKKPQEKKSHPKVYHTGCKPLGPISAKGEKIPFHLQPRSLRTIEPSSNGATSAQRNPTNKCVSSTKGSKRVSTRAESAIKPERGKGQGRRRFLQRFYSYRFKVERRSCVAVCN